MRPKTFSLGIEFSLETTGCGFHNVSNWLGRLTRGVISLLNGNHVDNNLKAVLITIYPKIWRAGAHQQR